MPANPRELFRLDRADTRDRRNEARTLNQLALVRDEMGDQDTALKLYEQSLAVAQLALGPDDPERATMLANFGGLQRRRGRPDLAETELRHALEIETRTGRARGPGAAVILNQLGLAHQDRGDYDTAELEFDKARQTAEGLLAPSPQLLGTIRNNIALLDRDRGDDEAALHLLEGAVADQVRIGQGDTPRAATLLHNLADTYAIQGRPDCAGPLYENAARIWERRFSPDYPDALRAMVSLAGLDRGRGDLNAAERRLQPTLRRLESRLGLDSPEVARTRNNLAEVLRLEGKKEASAALYRSALSGIEQSLGEAHPDAATILLNQGVLAWQRGAITEAVRLTGEATERRERTARVLLAYGSEQQKLVFARSLSGETAAVISLQAAAPDDFPARKLAFETVIRRKGRVLDEAAALAASASRRDNAATYTLLDEWRTARASLATLLRSQTRLESGSNKDQAFILDERIQDRERQLIPSSFNRDLSNPGQCSTEVNLLDQGRRVHRF